VERLAGLIGDEAEAVATLAGVRVHVGAQSVRIVRDAGEAARGGLAPLRLTVGTPAAWDGRYELVARIPGLEVRRLAGLAGRLPRDEKAVLAALPAAARPGLPAIVHPAGEVTSPVLGVSPADAVALTEARLLAAAGLIQREPP
jgi:tRNA(Ile)-lysidine synthase